MMRSLSIITVSEETTSLLFWPCVFRELAATMKPAPRDRKSTRLNSSHGYISYAVFCLKKKKKKKTHTNTQQSETKTLQCRNRTKNVSRHEIAFTRCGMIEDRELARVSAIGVDVHTTLC